MAKKSSPHGGAPKRSQRSRLQDKGYSQYSIDGCRTFGENGAKSYVKYLHMKGFLAQALHIRSPDGGDWWIVMYRRKD